jgi:pimeloyl-ACP methyl ester carboxylesterase
MLYHQTSGSGNTIVLVHGFCENNTCFDKQVLLLNKRHFVVSVDLPGFGKSESIPNTSMNSIADLLYLTLQKLNITKPVIIGHSMGGYVALAYAKKYVASMSGIILLHSTALADSEDRKAKRMQSVDFINKHGVEPFVRNFIPPLFAQENNSEKIIDEAINQGLSCTKKGLTQALLAMKERNGSIDFIRTTHLPVGYIAGKEDAIIPLNDLLSQSSVLHNGMVTILENSGHMGMLEEPEKCAQAIANFVAYCNYATAK